jgi:hypothetical protein
MIRWNNFIANLVYINFIMGLISICHFLFELDISMFSTYATETQ